MKLQTLACLILIVLVAAFASAQQSRSSPAVFRSGSLVDWAQFNFDAAHDGYNPYESILSPTTVGNVTLKWSYQPSEGYGVTGAPVVANGVMYFGISYTGLSDDSFAIYALNADTGAFIWKSGTEPIFGSPAVANGVVYAIDTEYLYALDASTGAIIWQYGMSGGQYSSPTVVNGVVYVAGFDTNVYALNATTGKLIWEYPTGGPLYISPVVANGVLYVSSSSGTVYGLNAGTGALIWQKQFGASIGPSRSLAGSRGGQAVANGVLYVGIQRKTNVYDLYALDASTGTIVWRKTVDSLSMETPAVANGVVYIVSGDVVYALNATTGAVVWQVQGYGSSPVVANGVVYIGAWMPTGNEAGYGTITALNASTGESLWVYQTESGAGYGSFPTPAVVNGMIYGSRISAGANQVAAWGLPNQ